MAEPKTHDSDHGIAADMTPVDAPGAWSTGEETEVDSPYPMAGSEPNGWFRATMIVLFIYGLVIIGLFLMLLSRGIFI